MNQRAVITAFLEHDGKILLLRRSERVRSYPGRWAGVSGSIESKNTPEQQARTEIREETGLADADLRLAASGDPLAVDDAGGGRHWLVHPFRFVVLDPARIHLDWEHVESRWIDAAELTTFDTVPNLAETWERVRAPSDVNALIARFTNDREHGASWLAREALRIVGLCVERSTATTPSDLVRDISTHAVALIEARPGMASVRFWIEWLLRDLATAAETGLSTDEFRSAVATLVESLIAEAERVARVAAENAATRLPADSVVFTASFSGTVLEACQVAHGQGKLSLALVAESVAPDGIRHGERLAQALRQRDIPVEVVADAAIAQRVSDATVVWLGADTIFTDGSVLNGTPSLALADAARGSGRPVEIICESAKIDGWTTPETSAAPPGFDRVPAGCIAAVITDQGAWKPDGIGGDGPKDSDPHPNPLPEGEGTSPLSISAEMERGQGGEAALVTRIATLLGERRETVAVVESAAGGRICDLLTDRPGSSAWFAGGLLAYSNGSKQRIAGVSAEILSDFGAVSAETARALAEGAQHLFDADWGIGETGIAGPQTGRRSAKSAGLAHLAVVGPGHHRQTIDVNTGSDTRSDNKQAFAVAALTLLVDELEKPR